MILQDVQANATIAVDIWMVDTCGKVALGRLEGVVSREMDVEEEDSASIR